MSEPVRFVSQKVDLDYKVVTSPIARRFDDLMREGRITGHKCPRCGRVYVPPRGFCPIDCVITDESNEVDVRDSGTVTSFTVITPIQYQGQKETEEYVLANILLDGASGTVGQQRIEGIAHDEVRMGMRVKAVWGGDTSEGSRGFGLTGAIKHWEPSGEPDEPKERYQEHVL
jgi:uncharacterized OB-fold protein